MLSGTFLLWRSIGNYIFLNRSELNIATILSACLGEATPLPGNISKDQDRMSEKISLSHRNSKRLNQRNSHHGVSHGHKCGSHPGVKEW